MAANYDTDSDSVNSKSEDDAEIAGASEPPGIDLQNRFHRLRQVPQDTVLVCNPLVPS